MSVGIWIVIAAIVLVALLWPRRTRRPTRAEPVTLPSKQRRALDDAFEIRVKVSSGGQWRDLDEAPPKADARWHGPGETVNIAGFVIAGGMIYVGRFLPADPKGSSWSARVPDPALVNPKLEVASTGADTAGATMTYWPSYADIQPSARRAYLEWLAGGKCDPHAYIGYVFLYFYGLERRLLLDRPPAAEARQLVAEVERLRGLYATNGSFDRYSQALLDAVATLGLIGPAVRPEEATPNLLAAHAKLPLPLKIRIGRMIKEGQPLPFEFALAAYMSASRLPMPAERCRGEFVALMRHRFARKYPQGFKVRPRHGPLQAWYTGANRHLSFDLLEGKTVGNIPDPDLMSWERLDGMVEEVCEALGPYARFIGRRPDKSESLEAKNLLPAELKADAIGAVGADLRAWLEREAAPLVTVPLKDLAARVLRDDEKLGTKTLRALADILDEFGYGVEPDPRFTTFRAAGDDVAVVFKAPNPADLAKEPREAYRLASAIVTLVGGIANASADGLGAQELRWLEWIDKRLALTPIEAARLRAHLYWLVAKKLTFAQVKKMMATVPAGERASIARFAAAVAAADGTVDKAEVAFLEKIYDELGVERSVLYAALNDAAAVPSEPAAASAVFPAPVGFKIPKPPKRKETAPALPQEPRPGALDPARVAKIMADTHQVSALLASVFVEETAPAAPNGGAAAPPSAGDDHRFDGLDAAHGRLLAQLLARDSWSRDDFEALARAEGLMPDGALETINEWSYDVADDALIEDDAELKINQTLAQELAT